MKKIHDLTNEDNSELYQLVQNTYAFKERYNTDPSLIKLKITLDSMFLYTEGQWEYLEVMFKEDLEERMA